MFSKYKNRKINKFNLKLVNIIYFLKLYSKVGFT